MRIGVVVNRKKRIASSVVKRLRKLMDNANLKYMVESEGLDRSKIVSNSDLVIVLGGDGTLINIVQYLGSKNLYVLGINLGQIGMLTEFTTKQLNLAVDLIKTQRFNTTKRRVFKVIVYNMGKSSVRKRASFLFLNDIVILRDSHSRIAHIDLIVDDKRIKSFLCDGMILSSTTGSTAHMLSAGGAIVEPAVDAIMIMPICAHMLSNRPIIISKDHIIKLRLTESSEAKDATLSIDGQQFLDIDRDNLILIRSTKRYLLTVKNPQGDFFSLLTERLRW
jgi:NAD+ kinase